MANILHITPHFGGGVGTVLRALVDGIAKSNSHNQEVVSLEYLNQKTVKWVSALNIPVYADIQPESEWISQKVFEADVVHIHFWNHPALYHLFYTISGCSARIVMWSHVNGHFAPYLFNAAVVNFPTFFVVSTQFSLSQKILRQKSKSWKEKHLRTVHSTAGLNDFDKIERTEHKGIHVGYVGTVDYAKIHRDFIDIFASVEHKDARFIICGGNSHEEIRLEAHQKGVASRFEFLGPVDDVKNVFSTIDIFAYPLNRENYGTGEQVLIEAMSAGIPQVVFADGPEEIVVADGETGLVCKNKEEFINAIELLCNNSDLCNLFQTGSRQRAITEYNFEIFLKKWLSIYDELLLIDKATCHLNFKNSGDLGFDLFFLSLGECEARDIYEEIIQYYPDDAPLSLRMKASSLPAIFKGETRGSLKHYCSTFKSDRLLYLAHQSAFRR